MGIPRTEGQIAHRFPRRKLRLPRRTLKCPLAVPEKRIGCSALFLAFFDRGAKPCLLVPPQAALAGFARNDRSIYQKQTGQPLIRQMDFINPQRIVWQPPCGARKNLRAYADPRFFRPRRHKILAVSSTGRARILYPQGGRLSKSPQKRAFFIVFPSSRRAGGR